MTAVQPIDIAPVVPPRPAKRWFNLSPLDRRRIAIFRANRRGWWSLWIFTGLFLISMFSELIANDKPLLVIYKGGYYTPFATFYPETAFGGDFETEAEYRDPFLLQQIKEANGTVIWPIVPYKYDTIIRDLPTPPPSPPSSKNWLGTDDHARDVLARVLYGYRISIEFGLLLTIFTSIIGIAAGAFQGYFGGWTDLVFQRVIEVWGSMPSLYILIIVASVLPTGFWILLAINVVFGWTTLVGYVRAEFLRGRNLEYVRAAKAMGLSNLQVMFRHILPNALVSTITNLPFITSASITTLTSLDFLGFGLPVGSPSLGELLGQAKSNLQATWLIATIFITLSLMLTLLVFIGEATRDALDPRKTLQ